MICGMKENIELVGRGRMAVCTMPTPGLYYGRHYEVLAVERDRILGPLLRVRDTVTRKLLPTGYYPWRFTLK